MKLIINNDLTSKIKPAKAKIRKLVFNETKIKNPEQEFDLFTKEVTSIVKRNEKITPDSFFAKLNALSQRLVGENKTNLLNNRGKQLAEKLVGLNNGDLAGIIYSMLIKINNNDTKLVEQLATNGLAIAKRFHDPVHIMARCEDLRKIYSITDPCSDKLLKVLYEEKRALNGICKNYSSAQNRFMTISKKMRPLENYQKMLIAIKIQIAKFLKDKNPNEAVKELNSAKEMLSQLGDGAYSKQIETLLNQLNN